MTPTPSTPQSPVTPRERVAEMGRALRHGDHTSALASYELMLEESPLLPRFHEQADMTAEEWLSALAGYGIFDGPCSLTDDDWVDSYHDPFMFEFANDDLRLKRGEYLTNDNIAEVLRRDPGKPFLYMLGCEAKAGGRQSSLSLSAVLLLSACRLTPAYAAEGSAWLPGSGLTPAPYENANARVADVVRYGNAAVRLSDANTTPRRALDMLTAIPEEGLVLGDATLDSLELTEDGEGRECLAVTYHHADTPSRTIAGEPDTMAELVLAAAWHVIDWLYAEATGPVMTTLLAFGYTEAVTGEMADDNRRVAATTDDRRFIEAAREYVGESLIGA